MISEELKERLRVVIGANKPHLGDELVSVLDKASGKIPAVEEQVGGGESDDPDSEWLEDLTVPVLRKTAEAKGIEHTSGMRKDDLVAALREAGAQPSDMPTE